MDIETLCFLNDGIPFAPDDFLYGKDGKAADSTIQGKRYRDPDVYSVELYKLAWALWGKDLGLELVEKGRYGPLLTDGRIKVTTDSIGPSWKYAHRLGVIDREIGAYLMVTRTIGGHLMWPSAPNSINMARGSRKYSDRIDAALFYLKAWYEGHPEELSTTFDRFSFWFHNRYFDTFPGFIDFFQLNPYVTSNYAVRDLTSNNMTCTLKTGLAAGITDLAAYRNFIANSCTAIQSRNKLLVDKLAAAKVAIAQE